MSDKMPSTQSLTISFTDGELPTASKLTALARQNKDGAAIFEKAIGDLWNQSNDTILSSYPLHIPNISRIIGDNTYLNPAIYPTGYPFWMLDSVSTLISVKEIAQSADYLWTTYPLLDPDYGTTFINTTCLLDTSGNIVSVGYTDLHLQPTILSRTGMLTITGWYDGMAYQQEINGFLLAYQVDFSNSIIGIEQLPSVIPDVRQQNFTGCRVSKTGSTFYLHLPPRQPIVFNGDTFTGTNDTNVTGIFHLPKYPVLNEYNMNKALTLNTDGLMFWQSETVNAFAHNHYRYHLPKEITTVFSSLAPGTVLPAGYMYLWNNNTNTIISDVVFKKPTNGAITSPWILEISSATFDFDTVDTSDESETSYSSTGLILITPGASISAHIANLYNLYFMGNHCRDIQDFSADLPSALLSQIINVEGNNEPITLDTDSKALFNTLFGFTIAT
jgi:hypothetical protein